MPHEDRNILISGCSSGIGRCVALALKARGYRVFAGARREDDCAALEADGLEALQLDLDRSDSIQAAVDDLLARGGGRLYGLFNNGAYGQPGAVEDISRDVLRAQLETNLLGTHELTRRVIPVMRAQGEGRIVQNSSVLGFVPLPYRGAYVCSKYALEGLTDTLRLELAGSGVFVSTVEPGPIRSRFRDNAYRQFVANIDIDASVHRAAYRAAETRLKSSTDARFTLPPEAVLKKVIHALESPRPKPRYFVTMPTYLLAGLKRVLSTRLMDAVLHRVSGGGAR